MDWLLERQGRIESALAGRHLHDGVLVLYDLSSSYFEGNTGDPVTLATQMDKIRNRFGLARVVLVGDRGMITEARIGEDSLAYERKDQRIAEKAALDGFYVIRTDLPETALDVEQTVRAYKSLAKVERAFRSLKTLDLNIRPIRHRLSDRVRAHVLLSVPDAESFEKIARPTSDQQRILDLLGVSV